MKRSKTVHPLGLAAFVGAMMALTGTFALAEESVLSDNWNTAGCSYTDSAPLSVTSAVHLKRVDLWFNWNTDETSVSYTLLSGGQKLASGSLSRGDCDPYQASWCIARGKPDVDLAPGEYTVQVESARVCQNGGSGGKGFIKAYGEPASGSVQTGASAVSSGAESTSSSEPEVPTSTAVKVAIGTVLGSVLISLGAAVATGISVPGDGSDSSTLTDIFKGKLPSDGFDDWKDKTEASGKIYGTGSSNDPYRDYPDADNPPWKPQYGDGTTADPYSDTAPPVIDTSGEDGEGPVFHTSVDLQPTLASGPDAVDTTTTVTHVESPAIEDTPPVKLEPFNEHIQVMGQLDDLSKAMQTATESLKSEGKFIANGTLIDKVRYGLPHLATSAIDWLSDAIPNVVYYPTTYTQSQQLIRSYPEIFTDTPQPPPHLTNPGWGQCGEAVEWGAAKLAEPVKQIFGDDAIFTQITIDSNYNPWGNHVANEVIAKNGDRYVIDMWQSMVDGKPAICSEDEWIRKWKSEPGIGSSATITRGGGTSPLESQLENHIRLEGVDRGIASFRAELPSADKAKADTVIRSFNAHPWAIKGVVPPSVEDPPPVISQADPEAAPEPPDNPGSALDY